MTEPAAPDSKRVCVTDGELADPVELREFLGQLALVMRLPPKKRGSAAATDMNRPAPGRRRAIGVALIGAALVVAGALAWPDRIRHDPLPPGAAGRWVTQEARYADRGFELGVGEIAFETGTGPQGAVRHPIRSTEVREDRARTIVTIKYLVDEEPMTFAFSFAPGASPTIRFKNQPEITWVKDTPGR